jgi:hypothetical protein
MRVVLVEMFGGEGSKRFVLDPALRSGGPFEEDALDDQEIARLRAAGLRFAEPLRLPHGRRVFAPTIEGLDARTTADWVVHAAPSPTPVDLDLPLPTDWFSEADWRDLEARGGADLDETWDAFHRSHPDSAGWIHLSDVGLSPDGDSALIYAWSLAGSLDGAGSWVLLVKRGGRWAIAKREVEWVS